MSPAILLIGRLSHTEPEWKALSRLATLKEYPSGNRDEFIANCKNGKYDDVVAMYHANTFTKVTGEFKDELIEALPKSLRFICHNGAGYDNIDVSACTARGVHVSNTPGAVNDATADIAIFLMLGALRHAHIPIADIRTGKWRSSNFGLGHDPQKKTLGILGMGGIGQEVAKRARAFGMKIIYHNRRRLSSELEGDAVYVTFDELLVNSDVLSLNLALNASTHHIISRPQFEIMKTGVVIVNTARGALIDEKALVEALDTCKVSSAGLDVFENEPIVEEGLLKNPRVMLLPHIGTSTYETQREMELLVLNNIKQAMQVGTLITPVPEQNARM